jgi:mRNA interferase MazF
VVAKRFEIWLVSLNPTVGAEMHKQRPAVVVSPYEMNERLHTVIVAPLTRRGFAAPFRVACQVSEVNGQVALDHLRSVDKQRLARKVGQLDAPIAASILATLREMFEE